MRFTLRAKLVAIVGVAATAFVLLIAASSLIARQVQRQLATIQGHYLPRAELGPELDGAFQKLRRGFQDAVSARDPDALAATAQAKGALVDLVARAGDAVDPAEAAILRDALDAYYASAYQVSRRLMADETGEALVDAVASMQKKQTRVAEILDHVAAVDPNELAGAFAAANHAERVAGEYRLAISVACLLFVTLLSTWLGRGILRSLSELTGGFRRFGAGDLAVPIRVASRDELGDVAAHANEMAASLERSISELKQAQAALTLSNKELEAFSYSVAHDLRSPLRSINGFAQALLEDNVDKLDEESKEFLTRICGSADQMGHLIDALLSLARITRTQLQRERVNMSKLAESVVGQLRIGAPDRVVEFANQDEVVGYGDPDLLRALLENLLGNAWKFTGARSGARIAFGSTIEAGGPAYYVQDNGAGFDMAYANKLFAPFQRLHTASEFAGTGIGLATVQRIVDRHGGRIWAEGVVGQGATFRFTLAGITKGVAP
jgi:signal transduction histidine kinase